MPDQGVDNPTGLVQYLYPVVPPIANVDPPAAVHRQSVGTREPVAVVPAIKVGDVGAIGVKLLYPVVTPIGNVHLPRSVHGHAPGHIELSRGVPHFSPRREECAIGSEPLDPVIQ